MGVGQVQERGQACQKENPSKLAYQETAPKKGGLAR